MKESVKKKIEKAEIDYLDVRYFHCGERDTLNVSLQVVAPPTINKLIRDNVESDVRESIRKNLGIK